MKQSDSHPKATDILLALAMQRFPSDLDLDRDAVSCGFRYGTSVCVAELRWVKTDKPKHTEVEFTLNVYELDPEAKTKTLLSPKLPHEDRSPNLMLPNRVLVVTRTFTENVTKEK